jgi:catechol 2,3-dioxygenase-like lactoylglutathione lyase family enzyme
MRALHVGLRVSDLERSLGFYTAVGYTVVGTVEGTAFGRLIMLRLPGDDFVTIELVHHPARGAVDLGTGINHLVIQVESLDATLADLAATGDRGQAARASRRRGRAADGLDHRPGRLPDRAGAVADRPCRRHHRGRLRLSRPPDSPTNLSITATKRFLASPGPRNAPTADGMDPARQATGRRSLIGMTARVAA